MATRNKAGKTAVTAKPELVGLGWARELSARLHGNQRFVGASLVVELMACLLAVKTIFKTDKGWAFTVPDHAKGKPWHTARLAFAAIRCEAIASLYAAEDQQQYLADRWTESEKSPGNYTVGVGGYTVTRNAENVFSARATMALNTIWASFYADKETTLAAMCAMLDSGFEMEAEPTTAAMDSLAAIARSMNRAYAVQKASKAAGKPKADKADGDSEKREADAAGSPQPNVPDHAVPSVNALESLAKALDKAIKVLPVDSPFWEQFPEGLAKFTGGVVQAIKNGKPKKA